MSPPTRQLIVALDRAPGVQSWNAVYWLVIRARPITTLWQAVAAVDPRCPTRLPITGHDKHSRRHGYYPSRLVLRLALRAAQRSRAA